MKRIIITPLLLIILIPQIALAAWWSPFSWFSGWNFSKSKQEEVSVEELRKEVQDLKKQLEETEIETAISTETLKIQEDKIDEEDVIKKTNEQRMRLEQERVRQEEAQERFQASLIQQDKDRINKEKIKVEEEIYQKELKRIEDENKLVEKNNKLVSDYDDDIREIDKEILELGKKFLKDTESTPGLTTSQYQIRVSNLTNQYNRDVQDLEFEKQDLYYEYQEKIEDLGI